MEPATDSIRDDRDAEAGAGELLRRNDISLQRTRTWKEFTDPDKEARLDRIEEVTTRFPDRCFAFDQFGPLSSRSHHGFVLVAVAGEQHHVVAGQRLGGVGRSGAVGPIGIGCPRVVAIGIRGHQSDS